MNQKTELLKEYQYNRSNFLPEIKYFAKLLLKNLPAEADTLVCSGTSGLSLATAMVCLSDKKLEVAYVNKKGEKRHASLFPDRYTYISEYNFPVFVDDFIYEGRTLKRCYRVIHFTHALFVVPAYKYNEKAEELIKRLKIKTIYATKHSETNYCY